MPKPVLKTSTRRVASLNYSVFNAKTVIRKEDNIVGGFPIGMPLAKQNYKVASLAGIVPAGGCYAYDLISEVGIKSYIEGIKLTEIQKQLKKQDNKLDIPLSSLFDLQRKFLFYFGALHRQSSEKIKDHLTSRGNVTWLIDGTIEIGTPVFFGIKEATEGFMLDCCKIPTENQTDISRCLEEAGELYGLPDEILHDLSSSMHKACETTFPGKPHRVCQFHFVRDVGDGLYKEPHRLLLNHLKKIKLKLYLKEQRHGQTRWLKNALNNNETSLVIKDLLNGLKVNSLNDKSFGREVFLAINAWILDYKNDGGRQGFPFDPYLLYFHRRIEKAYRVTKEIISNGLPKNMIPGVLKNFCNKLENYLQDDVILEAVKLYEKAYDIFNQLRAALQLAAKSTAPLFFSYDLSYTEEQKIANNLFELKQQFELNANSVFEPKVKNLYKIAFTHLSKYENFLFRKKLPGDNYQTIVRTTNGLEQKWCGSKRNIRQIKGSKKLTREFNSLPGEYMLISNLTNSIYVDLVLGSLDKLPEKLAHAAGRAIPFSQWMKLSKPLAIGRLPKKTIRNENFVDDLITVCRHLPQ